MENAKLTREKIAALKDAQIKYAQALWSKQGVNQARTLLSNLMLTDAEQIMDALTLQDKAQERIDDLLEENQSLSVALVEKHKEIAALKDELGKGKGKRGASAGALTAEDGAAALEESQDAEG